MTDEQRDGFPHPPVAFTDGEGREITIREGADLAPLVATYDEFDISHRAQGLPPVGERRIREWLDVLSAGHNVVAWHDDRPVGHATLLDCADGTHELTVFVHQDYQLAGIGSRLVRALLGLGVEHDVGRVWLTVQRSNHVAMNLYRSVGFETSRNTGLEHEMELDLDCRCH